MKIFLNLLFLPIFCGKNDKRAKKEEKPASPKILQNPIDQVGNRGETSKFSLAKIRSLKKRSHSSSIFAKLGRNVCANYSENDGTVKLFFSRSKV